MILLSKHDAFLSDYLTMMSDMMNNSSALKPARSEFHYVGGMYQLLREHGRFWQPAPLRSDVKAGVIKQCFDNAYKLAKRRGWRYVEGIAHGVVIPMHHAWCVDDNGNVVDNTWREVGESYCGVEIPTAYVAYVRRTTGLWASLDNWRNRHEIYKQPFSHDALLSLIK